MAVLGKWSGGTVSILPTTSWAAPNALFPTQDRNDGSAYSWSSSTSTLTLPSSDLADGYLLVAAYEFEDTSNGRHNPQGRFIQASGTGTFVSGTTSGYNRDTSEDRSYVRVWAFVDSPSASATFTFQWQRDTDTPTGGTVRSELQVIPFYYADIGLYTSTSTTATGGTTPTQITGFTGTDGTNITISSNVISVTGDNKRYVIFGASYHDTLGGGSRTQRWAGLEIDGTFDHAAKAYTYYRNTSNDEGGDMFTRIIETATATVTIEMNQYRGAGVANLDGGADVDGATTSTAGAHSLVVLELHDDAEVFMNVADAQSSLLATTGPVDLSIATTTGIEFNDAASWTRASDTGMNAVQTCDALLGANVSVASNNVANTTRWTAFAEFTINGTEDTDSFGGDYMRNNQSSQDTFGWSANLLGFTALTAGDDVGVSVTELTGSEGGGAGVSPANWTGFWGINLDTLQAPTSITREPPQADLAIDLKTPTIAGGPWKAAVNTNITEPALDTLCHIVFSYMHNGAALANDAPQLEYRVNGGSWADVNATSLNVRSQASTRIADGTDVPDLIGTGGTFITDNDGYDDVNGAAGGAVLDWPDGFDAGPNDRVNLQYAVVFRSADLTAGGEEVDLRIKGLDSYEGQGYARATMATLGGDLTANPPQGDLVIDLKTPGQTVEYFRNPPQGDLVIDPKTPTQTIEWFRSVPQTDLAITTEAPTVNEEFYRNPPQGDLVIDLKTPTAVEAWRRSVPQTDLVIDLKTPDVFIQHFRNPPQADLVIDTKTPTVNEVHIKLVPQTDLVITTEAPTVNESVLRQPPQTDLVIDEKIPTVDETHVKTVPQADLVIDPKTPTVNETHTKTVPGLDLVITTEAPNVEISVFRSVPQTDLVIDEKTPDVFVEFFRTVPQADLVLDMKTPGTGGTVFRSPDQANLVIDTKTPTTLIDFFRSPGKLDLVLDMKTPDVVQSLYRRIPQTDLVIDLKVPSIFEEITRLVEHADLIIDLKTPTVIIPADEDEEDTHDPGHDKTDWYEDEEREFDEPERSERAKLEDRLRLLYQGIDPDEVPGEYQDALHDAVSPFRVDGEVSPALPAAKDVDFEALIAAGEQAIKTATKAIGLAAARQAALQRQEEEDEAIAILLLL